MIVLVQIDNIIPQHLPLKIIAKLMMTHSNSILHLCYLSKHHLSGVFFEQKHGVELKLLLGAGDDGHDHVVRCTVVLPPQLIVSLVAMEIF